jgi:hypothetical protein
MRRCRYHKCRQPFEPQKDFYFYCSWGCRVADVGSHYEDGRGYQRERNEHYNRGYWDGVRSRPPTIGIPKPIWLKLLAFSHPDKWMSAATGIRETADEVTRWLLEHRPS